MQIRKPLKGALFCIYFSLHSLLRHQVVNFAANKFVGRMEIYFPFARWLLDEVINMISKQQIVAD